MTSLDIAARATQEVTGHYLEQNGFYRRQLVPGDKAQTSLWSSGEGGRYVRTEGALWSNVC